MIGIPDERLGEEVCAWIKLKNGCQCTPEEIKDFCKGEVCKQLRFKKFLTKTKCTLYLFFEMFEIFAASKRILNKLSQTPTFWKLKCDLWWYENKMVSISCLFSSYFTHYFAQYLLEISLADIRYLLLWFVTIKWNVGF